MTTSKNVLPKTKLSHMLIIPILSTAITLLVIELILLILINMDVLKFDLLNFPNRTEGLYEYDADLGWKLRPLYGEYYEKTHGFAFDKVNADGWRDNSYTIEKPKDVYRIAIIGCSRTYGYGVNMQDSYPKALERILDQRSNKKSEVMNFGVNGYGLSQMTLNYSKYVRKYDPDLIILQFYAPSILRTNYTRIWKTNKPTFKIIDGKLTLINHPVPINKTSALRSWLFNRSPLFVFVQEKLLKIDNNHQTNLKEALPEKTELHTLNTAIFKHLKDQVKNDGKKLVVFIWGENNEWLKQIVENAGVEIFTIEDYADIDEWKEKGALENDPPIGHWSPLGNQYVAEAIFQYLFKKGADLKKSAPLNSSNN